MASISRATVLAGMLADPPFTGKGIRADSIAAAGSRILSGGIEAVAALRPWIACGKPHSGEGGTAGGCGRRPDRRSWTPGRLPYWMIELVTAMGVSSWLEICGYV